MKHALSAVSAAGVLWLSCVAGFRAGFLPGPEKQKGMSYATWSAGAYSLPDSDVSLEHLAETGTNWIALVVTCYQGNLTSLQIAANETTPTDADLIHVIRRAQALGLKVMLKPHLDLASDPAHWRGEIGQAYTTEAQWNEWFASYRNFIEHYAELASTYGADQFCVGTELEGTTYRVAEWRKIVAAVRTRYNGPIIYAANHSGEELRLSWWDAVDFIGVDAYYPLAIRTDASLSELEAAWQPRAATLAGLAARWQKPIVLTEIGYRSIDGAATHPWDYQVAGKIDLEEQADCYRAALEGVYGQPWFAGIYWWAWSPNPRQGGPTDDNYTPHDKPAEDILRAWYGGGGGGRAGVEAEPDPERAMDIFRDGLAPNWQDRSWDCDRDFHDVGAVLSGQASLGARLNPGGALSFSHQPFATHPYFWLEFALRSASGSLPDLWVYVHDREGSVMRKIGLADGRYIQGRAGNDGSWAVMTMPLVSLGAAMNVISGVSIQDRSGSGSEKFWVDDLRLVGVVRKGRKSEDKPILPK